MILLFLDSFAAGRSVTQCNVLPYEREIELRGYENWDDAANYKFKKIGLGHGEFPNPPRLTRRSTMIRPRRPTTSSMGIMGCSRKSSVMRKSQIDLFCWPLSKLWKAKVLLWSTLSQQPPGAPTDPSFACRPAGSKVRKANGQNCQLIV